MQKEALVQKTVVFRALSPQCDGRGLPLGFCPDDNTTSQHMAFPTGS
jgi:hypothetical protein